MEKDLFEIYLRALVESSEDMMFVIDREMRIRYVNSYASACFGMPAEKFVGMPLGDFFSGETFERQREKLHEVFGKGEPVLTFEKTVFPTAVRWLETRLLPVKDGGEMVTAVLGISRDVTEQKQAEDDLVAAESKFRSLVERSLVGIYIIQDGKFAYANPKLAEIFGYSREEMPDMSVLSTVAEESREVVGENIRKRIEGETESIHYEFKGIRKDKAVIDVEVHGSKTIYDGKPAVIGTLLDVTERRKMEAEAKTAEKIESLGVFAGEIGHEFNNLLTAIVGNISLAKMYTKPGYEAYDILTEIEKASARAKGISQQLLAFAHGASKESPPAIASLLKSALSPKGGEPKMALYGRGRVLVMDDDELVRVVAGRMLLQCGYEAETAHDGEEAIRLYKKAMDAGKPYDAVIIDLIVKEGLGGKETMVRLLEIDPSARAIVSSGYSDDPVLANYKDHGFRAALAKPYEPGDLGCVLGEVLKKS